MKVELFVFHFVQVLEGYESSRDDVDYGGDLYPKLYISQVIKTKKIFKSYELFIPFFVLVDEVTKNKNRLRDLLYNVFRLQGKTGKTKMKKNEPTNKQTNLMLSFIVTFINQKEKRKMG